MEKAIVQMNALVPGAYIHFLEGLAQLRKLTEEDENQLSADMEDVGAHHLVSVGGHLQSYRHEQYYYLRFHYYKQSETLKEDINLSQNMLQDTQQELHLLQADLLKALTDKEQSVLKLEEAYQQNEEDKKDFIKLKAEIIRLLDHKKVKTHDYGKIIEQNREEYSQLEAVNQEVEMKVKGMDEEINTLTRIVGPPKLTDQPYKEIRIQLDTKDKEIQLLMDKLQDTSHKLNDVLTTIKSYMEAWRQRMLKFRPFNSK
ncbi:hypothetical protein C8J57DRAFT_1250768 [Mycena rebaudengoi]|nr:hypothetical protein C8J57DRAFT_1250768 [Mycena rebaudengoi]